MYTEKCSESNLLDDTASLLAAATKYQVEGLVDYCEEVLCASLNVDTVCELLMLADLYHALVLKENCVNFITQNANDVMIKGTIADLDAALRQEVQTCLNHYYYISSHIATDATRTLTYVTLYPRRCWRRSRRLSATLLASAWTTG